MATFNLTVSQPGRADFDNRANALATDFLLGQTRAVALITAWSQISDEQKTSWGYTSDDIAFINGVLAMAMAMEPIFSESSPVFLAGQTSGQTLSYAEMLTTFVKFVLPR